MWVSISKADELQLCSLRVPVIRTTDVMLSTNVEYPLIKYSRNLTKLLSVSDNYSSERNSVGCCFRFYDH